MLAIKNAPTGLSSAEANLRLAAFGPNEVAGEPPVTAWRVLASQFQSFVVWLLMGASLVSAMLGEVADALAIAVIVFLNAVIGCIQELRAERAIEALRSITSPRTRVLRDGRSQIVPTREVVAGDTLLLEAGDVIGADATLVEATALRINEAILTGESVPVTKAVGDDVLMATSVMAGTGVAQATRIGDSTELGGIAKLTTHARNDETPLRGRVRRLTQVLVIVSLAIVVVIAVISLLRGEPLASIFLTAVSLAVAAVPEGLPAIVTLALAIGVNRMARRNVLVRKLDAVETLGCTTVICTDKTGTLTTGVMTVRELWGPDETVLIDAATACCDAELTDEGRTGTGDPTEVAIIVAAHAKGVDRSAIEASRARVVTRPFDDERRRMAVLRADGVLYVKGAVESVLPLCSEGTDGVVEANQAMAARGLRVLAVATGRGEAESGLHFRGLIGIADPPRDEAIVAVREAREAGIATVMITGDHKLTAHAIAVELGIITADSADAHRVHARATPADKLQIVRTLKGDGAIVAMTGDGVNDAPALREAHIGIAMGKSGTSVAREAADIVLADDNFASIVHGIREGRTIFDSIRRALIYLLSGNVAELALVLTCCVVGLPVPLLPLQLLWINLVTDGMPALALVMQRSDADVMAHGPRATTEPLIGRPEWTTIAVSAVLQTSVTVSMYVWAIRHTDTATARSLTFSLVVLCELVRALVRQRPDAPLLSWSSSRTLVMVVVLSGIAQQFIQSLAVTRRLFQLRPLSLAESAVCLGLALGVGLILELALVVRRKGASS